ncbi:MAG: NAD-dependent epimerase/dehydratase family protein [Desulfobacula sp.]|uniref:NAD-dependent epimerase/dehydratase family protein n=1 Tax=Desulfobacula sp. TaxID=2593537 RepID=UPI0025BF008C|nr:NAD-dependent epimerase/dehydratase family protein [Desulfobacula sp.]MCD4720712.1 NAD-dependent epimerase/dehydratase family protein [Desulfobacula sp.]
MKVLVTGANGHLGYNLIKGLLKKEHTVRGSIRSLKDTRKVQRLKSLGDIDLVEADLNRPDQLEAAMEGIDLLFHTAAVYSYTEPGRKQEIIDASIKGIENTFYAAVQAKVRKIVLTSSVVTLPMTLPNTPPSNESNWTNDKRVPYIKAKTEGEKLAWKIAREKKLHMVSILPGTIAGPGFARNTPTIDVLEALMMGAMRLGVMQMNYPYVDVRDVVTAHILAGEKECEGRFIVCNDISPMFRDIIETMHSLDSKIPLPLMTLPNFMMGAMGFFDKFNRLTLGTPLIASPEFMATMKGKLWNFSNQRIKDVLGWQQQISMEQSLHDTIEEIRKLKSQK